MNLIDRVWQSSLGRKYLMALTGAALFLFLIGHLLGNLQVFGPPELINEYAHFLKSKPGLLWGARLGLLACVAVHIASAVSLSALNKAARPVGYAKPGAYGASRASHYMLASGLVILAFVVYHLAHFTALLPGTARSMRRMARITGRTDDMLIIRGVNVFPTQIEELILKVPELSPHYVLEVRREDRLDALDIVVEAKPAFVGKGDAEAAAAATLAGLVKSYIGISARVRPVPAGGVADRKSTRLNSSHRT